MAPDLTADAALAQVASCLAEPARARMLCCLMDGHARTATELATAAEVAASTASTHLARLLAQALVTCTAQGRHRYYRLAGHEVGAAVEALLVLTGLPRPTFKPSTPEPLREARRCYDHLAGHWGVRLHDHALAHGWLQQPDQATDDYILTDAGMQALAVIGVDVQAVRHTRRRRLACACMDWSERRPHLGGALGAACLQTMLAQQWLEGDLDSRVLRLTARGQRYMGAWAPPAASCTG